MGRRPFIFYQRAPRKRRATKRVVKIPVSESARSEAKEYDWFVAPVGTSPESTLAMAVLQRAILDLITPGTPPRFRKSALEWLKESDDVPQNQNQEEENSLTFEKIAEAITDMSPGEFRKKILCFVRDAGKTRGRADAFRFQRG